MVHIKSFLFYFFFVMKSLQNKTPILREDCCRLFHLICDINHIKPTNAILRFNRRGRVYPLYWPYWSSVLIEDASEIAVK